MHHAVSESTNKGMEAKTGASTPPMATKAGRPVYAGGHASWFCIPLLKWPLPYFRPSMLHHFSHVPLFVTLWTVAHQAPLSMWLCGQEYWNGLPCPPSGDLPNPGIEPMSLKSPALAGEFLPLAPPGKPYIFLLNKLFPHRQNTLWHKSQQYLFQSIS